MVEIEGPPYIDMDICLSGLLQNSGICWDATRGSSVGAFLHAVVVTGTDNVAVLAIGQKKKKTPAVRCNQPTNQGSSPGFGLPVFGPINSAHRHIVATLATSHMVVLRSQSEVASSNPIPSHIDVTPTIIHSSRA